MRPHHTSRPQLTHAPSSLPAAMLQVYGGAMYVVSSSLAYLTGCTITNSTASSDSMVRVAPADEGSHAEKAVHKASPHQPAATRPRPLRPLPLPCYRQQAE
jgi:hypothetical protein